MYCYKNWTFKVHAAIDYMPLGLLASLLLGSSSQALSVSFLHSPALWFPVFLHILSRARLFLSACHPKGSGSQKRDGLRSKDRLERAVLMLASTGHQRVFECYCHPWAVSGNYCVCRSVTEYYCRPCDHRAVRCGMSNSSRSVGLCLCVSLRAGAFFT